MNSKKLFSNNTEEGGFIKLILFLIVALFLMKYFDISVRDIINWIKELFNSVL